MKLKNLIIVFFTTIALILSLLGTSYFYYNSELILEDNVLSKLEATAQSRANHVETYLENNVERLKLITSRNKLRNTLKSYNEAPTQDKIDTMNEIIASTAGSIEEIEGICVANKKGIIITSTKEDFCSRDISEKEFFIQGKEKEFIGYIIEGDELKIVVSGPFILNNESLGVGILLVNSSRLERIVKERTGLGDSGEVLIANKDGEEINFLFERLFESDAVVDSGQTAEPMKQALLGNEIIFERALDYRNEPVLAVSQYIELSDIGLVTKVDIDEDLGTQREILLRTSLIIIFSVLFVFIIFGYFMSRYITKDIGNLTQDVNSISKGNLDIKLENSKLDEVQGLTNSLNRILASLKLAILRTGSSKESLGLSTKEAIKAKKEAEAKSLSRLKELERFSKLAENREIKMIELKKKLRELESKKRKNNGN